MAIANLTNLNATFPWNLTSAVTGILPVANGGTGGSSFRPVPSGGSSTQVLHGNDSWGAVSLTADVTGNLPVTNLASGTGATSSTFYRGDGSWAQALYQGNQILISAQTASASASIVFANFVNAAYRNYILKIQFIQPATDGQTLIAEVSNDGGSNYLNSGYQWSRVYASDGVVAQQGATNSAAFELNRGQINTDYCNAVFEIQVLGAGTKLRLLGKSYSWIPGPFQEILDQGANVNGTTLNTLRIKYPSGNIATGIVSLYGILA